MDFDVFTGLKVVEESEIMVKLPLNVEHLAKETVGPTRCGHYGWEETHSGG